jgi:nucleoside-diphosphate-sugar epimerase
MRAALRRQADLPCGSIVVGDINGETDWHEALGEVETVVHLAAYAHVTNPAMIDRDLLRRTNVEGTANLALQAAQAGVKQLVFLSSIGAVAESCEHMLSSATPCNPTTYYGESKLEAENLLKDIAAAHGMRWTIIRPPLVYGPGNPGNMQRLLKLVRSGLPLPLASVRNRRSFIYVENLTDLIVTCLANSRAFGKTFLPTDGEDVSTAKLIEKIAKAEAGNLSRSRRRRQAQAKLECSDGRCAARRARLFPFPESILKALGRLPGLGALRKLTSSLYVDSEPIRRELGWTPPFTMEEGLRRTLVTDYEKLD